MHLKIILYKVYCNEMRNSKLSYKTASGELTAKAKLVFCTNITSLCLQTVSTELQFCDVKAKDNW